MAEKEVRKSQRLVVPRSPLVHGSLACFFGTTPLISHSLHFWFEPWSCDLHRIPEIASQYALSNATTYRDYPPWAIFLSNVSGGDSHHKGFWFICVTGSPRATLLFQESFGIRLLLTCQAEKWSWAKSSVASFGLFMKSWYFLLTKAMRNDKI